jgi:hypothetical protein
MTASNLNLKKNASAVKILLTLSLYGINSNSAGNCHPLDEESAGNYQLIDKVLLISIRSDPDLYGSDLDSGIRSGSWP